MSGQGAPTVQADGTGMRVVIVAATWHATAMAALLDGAYRALSASGVTDVRVVRVPGSFELPVAASRIAASKPDAIVALGVVIRGGTPHFEYVCSAATNGLTDVAVRTGIPVGFGVLTCDDEEQVLARIGLPDSFEDKGADAALAAIATAAVLRDIASASASAGASVSVSAKAGE
ncbi:6,7-dimethyl-8-ribityllumazine synthase [Pseudoclavibacter sp. AY1F1]|uniref:6,7-dimethyl-8-ribityllumazine synthase n=1 Tax=Pseudoclavibacter sp. AY1F1 TaxID=2080583 RepID=UPI000CE74C1D|nr:6,7-dimethyl-8-ribityllumazine synthase [Pseudoclavibacter sp. AY1F1]PPF44430.1 6,7-dimethyl-8-ribityllumazine synthase [Pseudoclavibacter sp. AY1F1]